jgi:hypothetical protein
MIKNKNELNIAFSLGSLIDTKKAEHILKTEGVKAFHETLAKHRENNSIFSPGPSLGFFMALRKLNKVVPDNILKVRFGLISKIDPNPNVSAVILESMKHYLEENKEDTIDSGLDVIMLTNGKDTTYCHKVFDTDLMFTTSRKSAIDLFQHKIPAVAIQNIDYKENIELYEKRNGNIVLFTDYDGVIGDAESEKIFQKHIKKTNVDNAIEEFIKHEFENEHLAMDLGPLGKVIQKLGRVVKYQKEQQKEAGNNISLLEIIVVTARGGQSHTRLMKTIEDYKIEISELYMMQGQNKNDLLVELGNLYKGHNLLFFDDSEIHFKRSQELRDISSAWVPNDENTAPEKNK